MKLTVNTLKSLDIPMKRQVEVYNEALKLISINDTMSRADMRMAIVDYVNSNYDEVVDDRFGIHVCYVLHDLVKNI